MKIKNRSNSMALCKFLGMILAIACFVFGFGSVVRAEVITSVSGAAVSESRTDSDGVVYFYIQGVDNVQNGSSVQIGNTVCEDVSGTTIGTTGLPIRTILILDNSNSLSIKLGEEASRNLMMSFIDNRMEGEQFKIVTVSDTYTELSDFSADYEGLKQIIGGIVFENQDTYLTDCLYSYLSSESTGECFTRIILITDGADDNEITYTQTELNDLMKTANVVIHTIGASSGNSAELERLFSYSRITKGVGVSVPKGFDAEETVSYINQDYNMYCLRVVPPNSIMDGSVKAVLLKLMTGEGEADLTCNAQMAFGTAEAEPVATEAPAEVVEEVKPSNDIPTIELDDGPKKEDEAEKGISPVLIIVIVVAVLAVITAIVIVISRKKKKDSQVIQKAEQPEQPVEKTENNDDNKTVILSKASNNSGETVLLWGNESKAQNLSKIILTDTTNAQRVFSSTISDKITLGRIDSNDITISDDGSVSGHHLEIIKKGHLYYIKDLNSSNGTKINGLQIQAETAVVTGSTVEIGRGTYKITIEDN